MPALPVHPPQDRETLTFEGMCLTGDGSEVGKVVGMGSVSGVPSARFSHAALMQSIARRVSDGTVRLLGELTTRRNGPLSPPVVVARINRLLTG